jgi:hypothetical protein
MYSTTAQACIALRFNKARLNELARKGKIPRGPRPNQWDIDACRVALGRNLDIHQASPARGDVPAKSIGQKGQTAAPAFAPPSGGTQRGTIAHAQLKHEEAKAAKATIEVLKLEGKLVETKDAISEWGRMISSARAAILLAPDKLAPKVAPVLDVRECRSIIAKEMNQLLSELSEYRPHE